MYTVSGRILNIKKTKNNVFLKMQGRNFFQIVIRMNLWILVGEGKLYTSDIITAEVELDTNNNSKYKAECPSYLAKSIFVISKSECCDIGLSVHKSDVAIYSKAKSRVRNFLEEKGYIEVNIPILTDGETSSKAASFQTVFKKTGKILFLRKTMDSFMRLFSCSDYDKIYSIGNCFRNEFVTSTNASEFEMLSIFSNYISIAETIDLADSIIRAIVGTDFAINRMSQDEYDKSQNINGFVLVDKYKHEANSYAEIGSSGYSEEFKIKYSGITVVHGVKEISSIEMYNEIIREQGKKDNYGELELLEKALKHGAPPCYNLGISIVRIISLFNNKRIRDYDPLSLYRLNFGHQIQELL